MDKTSGLILSLGGAFLGAMVAPFLVGAIGFLACRVVAWVTGDPRYWNGMWLVYFLAVLSAPVAFIAVGITCARRLERRGDERRDERSPRGFPVTPTVRGDAGDSQ